MLTIKLKVVAIIAYLLMLVPVLVFFIGWLEPIIGVCASILLSGGLVWIIRKDYWRDKDSIQIPLSHFIGMVVVFAAFVSISGIAGIGVSGYDIPWRNAVLHDLIDYDWPVVYENGNALVYYCTLWLPAALVGKVLGWVGALVFLWLYIVTALTISFLLILLYLDIKTPAKMWLTVLFLILWSGMTFLGAALVTAVGHNNYEYPLLTDGTVYLDALFNGESFNWHYRSNYEMLQMTYNQIPLWLAVPLMMKKRTTHSYLYLGLLLLPYSPWGFIGIIPLMIVCAMPELISFAKQKQAFKIVKAVFSPANLAALIVIVPIFVLYFLASSKAGGAASSTLISPDMVAFYESAGLPYTTQSGSFGFLSFDRFGIYQVAALILFYLLEFGIFMGFIRPKYRKDPLFWVVFVVLLITPLMWIGTINGRDFHMNGSLPALFTLMILTLGFTMEKVCGKPLGIRNLLFVVVLFLAFIGPAYSMLGKVQTMFNTKSILVIDDSIRTFSDKPLEEYSNFLVENPQETPFYKYLARS